MIELYPYSINDGMPSMRDTELLGLYKTMEMEKNLDRVYYNMSHDDITPEWWTWYMKERCQLFVILESRPEEKREIIGIVWLNHIVGRKADIHYCMFKPAWGRASDICAKVMKMLFDQTEVDCFVALIPEYNHRAVGKPVEYGFKSSAILKKACYIATLGKSVNGHQYTMARRGNKKKE